MTRKHYKALAQEIAGATEVGNGYAMNKEHFITGLCRVLQADNELFDEKKFREACK